MATSVMLNRTGSESSSPSPLRSSVTKPGPDAVPCGGHSRLAAVDEDPARSAFVRPEDEAHRLGASRADQPGEADDFPVAHLEGDVPDPSSVREVFHLETDLPDLRIPRGELLGEFPSDHHRDQFVLGGLLHLTRAAVAAVAQDGQPVGHPEDFLQPVGDEDHRDPLLLQRPDDRKQDFRLP